MGTSGSPPWWRFLPNALKSSRNNPIKKIDDASRWISGRMGQFFHLFGTESSVSHDQRDYRWRCSKNLPPNKLYDDGEKPNMTITIKRITTSAVYPNEKNAIIDLLTHHSTKDFSIVSFHPKNRPIRSTSWQHYKLTRSESPPQSLWNASGWCLGHACPLVLLTYQTSGRLWRNHGNGGSESNSCRIEYVSQTITSYNITYPTHQFFHFSFTVVQGMSYSGTIDIMHDKARFYTGNSLATEAQKLTKEEIEARRDEHGNYNGVDRRFAGALSCQFEKGTKYCQCLRCSVCHEVPGREECWTSGWIRSRRIFGTICRIHEGQTGCYQWSLSTGQQQWCVHGYLC